MNNDYIVLAICFVVCIWLTSKIIGLIRQAKNDFKEVAKINNDISKWPKVRAKILKKGFNLDYVYQNITLEELQHFLGEFEFNDYAENQLSAEHYLDTCGGIMIYYGYIIEGSKYFSRDICLLPLPTKKNEELFYSVNKGELIDVYVNPRDSNESYLLVLDEKELSQIKWALLESLMPHMFLTFIGWASFAYGIYYFLIS